MKDVEWLFLQQLTTKSQSMKQLTHLLTFILPGMLLCGCSEEFGQVTSQESMTLGDYTLLTDNEAKENITLDLVTEHDWALDAILSPTGSETIEWVTVHNQEGSGNSTVTLSCQSNDESSDRSAYLRFKIKGAYPEYRTCTLTQTGTPVVTTKAIAGTTAESITLSGSYTYTEDYVSKTGFEVWVTSDSETKQDLYCDAADKSFSAVCPIEYGKEYSYRAFVEGKDGKRFLAANDEAISIRFTLGTPSIDGEMRTEVDTKEASVVIPYVFGDGMSYTLGGSCDMEGLSLETKEVTFDPNGGEVRLAISGTPTTTGTATFTLTGLPDTSEPMTVSTEVLEGGAGLILYLETFGPNPTETSAFNLTKDMVGIGVISDDIVEFSRTGQPLAEYVRGTTDTNIRHETGMYSKPAHYAWASGSPCLHTGTNKQGIFTINHLNIKGAANIKFDFGYRCGSSPIADSDIVIEYSNDEGATWTQVAWETTGEFSTGKYIIIQTTEEIVGSADFSLRLTLGSPKLSIDARLDDLRLTGDYL